MSDLQMIKVILNGPVHCIREKDLTFYFTEGMNDNYACHDWTKGEWTVHYNGYLAISKTLELAFDKAYREWEEYYSVD